MDKVPINVNLCRPINFIITFIFVKGEGVRGGFSSSAYYTLVYIKLLHQSYTAGSTLNEKVG